MKRWKHRPEGSTWGDWGDDDQLGRLNLITPAKVLQGIAEVKEGRSFCLSLPLDYPGGNVLNGRRLPPVLSPTSDMSGWRFNFATATFDPRHTDVVLLSYEEICERRFGAWSMGKVDMTRLNPALLLRFSETTTLDPYAMSGRASMALFEELVATASVAGHA